MQCPLSLAPRRRGEQIAEPMPAEHDSSINNNNVGSWCRRTCVILAAGALAMAMPSRGHAMGGMD